MEFDFLITRFLLAAMLVMLAAVYDLRSRRIPNWLNLAGLVVGLITALWAHGAVGGYTALSGAGLALVIYFPLWTLRAMGAGDVKLMVALGSLLGPSNWLQVFLLTALYAGVTGLVYLVATGRAGGAMTNVGLILGSLARFRLPFLAYSHLSVRHEKALRLPHGASIALGCLTFVAWTLLA